MLQPPITMEDVEEVILREQRSPAEQQRPCVRIMEQPADRHLRFRYKCEGRSAGSLVGQHSTASNKTFPTIQILNHKGPAVVVVSCVTKDPPYRPHPHNLVGKSCKKGVFTALVSPTESQDMTFSFNGLGIQCVKKNDIEESLTDRQLLKVDPFQAGFSHMSQPGSIDLNAVRLAIQVFIQGPHQTKFNVPLSPVVSDPIYDKKALCELSIVRLSHCSAPCTGGTSMILLCEKVNKDDVEIWFAEDPRLHQGQGWRQKADFRAGDIYKQVAICFKTPAYHNLAICDTVTVYIYLFRPSDHRTSEPRPFIFFPATQDPDVLKRKKAKYSASVVRTSPLLAADSEEAFNQLLSQLQASAPFPQHQASAAAAQSSQQAAMAEGLVPSSMAQILELFSTPDASNNNLYVGYTGAAASTSTAPMYIGDSSSPGNGTSYYSPISSPSLYATSPPEPEPAEPPQDSLERILGLNAIGEPLLSDRLDSLDLDPLELMSLSALEATVATSLPQS